MILSLGDRFFFMNPQDLLCTNNLLPHARHTHLTFNACVLLSTIFFSRGLHIFTTSFTMSFLRFAIFSLMYMLSTVEVFDAFCRVVWTWVYFTLL